MICLVRQPWVVRLQVRGDRVDTVAHLVAPDLVRRLILVIFLIPSLAVEGLAVQQARQDLQVEDGEVVVEDALVPWQEMIYDSILN